MKVAQHKGMRIAVLTRDEHCPPHVHVDGGDWTARFQFAFWHNGVSFWDSEGKEISEGLKAEISATIKAALPKARKAWIAAVKKTCLENRFWNVASEKLERSGRTRGFGVSKIVSGTYDATRCLTTILLENLDELGIQL
jgi:hypothetical protein